jgi:hypothetical protein
MKGKRMQGECSCENEFESDNGRRINPPFVYSFQSVQQDFNQPNNYLANQK